MKANQRVTSRTTKNYIVSERTNWHSQMAVGKIWKMAIGFYNLAVVSDFRKSS